MRRQGVLLIALAALVFISCQASASDAESAIQKQQDKALEFISHGTSVDLCDSVEAYLRYFYGLKTSGISLENAKNRYFLFASQAFQDVSPSQATAMGDYVESIADNVYQSRLLSSKNIATLSKPYCKYLSNKLPKFLFEEGK